MKVILVLLLAGLFSSNYGKNFRVNQIPNGSKFSCGSCHLTPGGPRNDFGTEIENNFLDSNGNVLWNAALAALDSDNDGVSNGAELLDALGVWSSGMPDPGDIADVTNPGDPASFVGLIGQTAAAVPEKFELMQNYPNPFNPETTIRFNIARSSQVRLFVFDVLGQVVDEVINEKMMPGAYEVVWNAADSRIGQLKSGVYFYQLKTPQFSKVRRMFLIK